jgi:hypothetical protein
MAVAPTAQMGSTHDVPPRNWTDLSEKNPVGLARWQPRGFGHEEVKVY